MSILFINKANQQNITSTSN